jgi:hypothetical protein
MNNLYEIKSGAITVYVGSWNGKDFSFKGFTAEGDTENYYVIYNSSYDSPPADRKVVEIGKYLYDLYKTEADSELQKYIEDNIDNYDFYSECDEYNAFPFWQNIINSAGIEPQSRDNYDINLAEIMNSVVIFSIKGVHCRYNFKENKTISFAWDYTREEEPITSPMRIFYRGRILNELIALEQYRRNIAVPAYAELVKLREFLQGKKSLKYVMKSGEIYEYKRDSIYVSSILNQYYSDGELRFNLNNSYHLKPSMKTVQPLIELDYLQYGKQKHYINEQNLLNYKK